MQLSGIYCIFNTANGKRYIGQSVNISQRKSLHFLALHRGTHKNRHLQAAFLHYGPSAFRFLILDVAPQSRLDSLERSRIAQFKANDPRYGYNAEPGGLTRPRASSATRLRMQLAQSRRRSQYIRDCRDKPLPHIRTIMKRLGSPAGGLKAINVRQHQIGGA